MKRSIIATLIAATISSGAMAQDLDSLSKELEIMSGVIKTSLQQDTGRSGIRLRSINSTYLANQGVVFEINTSGKGYSISFNGKDISFPAPPAPPAPVAVITDEVMVSENNFEFIVEQEWEEQVNEAVHIVREVFSERSDELRDLTSELRDMAWEQREIERRKRDYEFELRAAERERAAEIKKEMAELEKEVAQVEKRSKALKEKAEELKTKQKEDNKKRKEAQEKAEKSFLAGFEASVGDTLCRYGLGLKEVPDAENISFVIKDFAKSAAGKTQDKVYVFNKQKVKQCVQERIDVEGLLASAKVYAF